MKMNRLLLGLGVFNSGINPPAEALCGALLPGAFGGLPAAPSSAPTLSGAIAHAAGLQAPQWLKNLPRIPLLCL